MIDAIRIHNQLGRPLDPLGTPLLAATRWWVGWQFRKAGWLKLSQWDSTVELFQYEYQVPLLSPTAAAVAGTLGLFAVNLLLLACARPGGLRGGDRATPAVGIHAAGAGDLRRR